MDENIPTEDINEDEDEIKEADIPSLIYWLIESYNSIDAMDTGLMGKERKAQVTKWKEKIWNTLDSYIQILPS